MSNKLMDKFPEFPLYSKEELEELSSEKLVKVFSILNKIKEDVNGKKIQLETQIESADKSLKDTQTAIFERYKVNTLEDLESLKKEEMINFQISYERLVDLEG